MSSRSPALRRELHRLALSIERHDVRVGEAQNAEALAIALRGADGHLEGRLTLKAHP
jgi:hypothetical protein